MSADPNLIAVLEPLVQRVRTDATAIRGEQGVQWKREALTPERLAKHLNGGPARGVGLIKPGESTTMVALLDLDSHKGEVSWEQMAEVAEQVIAALDARGLRAHPWRSGGGNGIHLIMLWDEPQDAHSVRRLLVEVLVACGYTNGTGGVAKHQIEVFPKQDSVAEGKFGNQVFLPLAGKSEPLVPELGLAPGGRQEAVGYAWQSSEPVPVLERPAREAGASHRVSDPEMLDRALNAIPNDIDNRDEWFRLMCAYKDGGGDKEVARNWTMRHPSYDDDKFDGPWDSIEVGKPDGATVDHLFRVAQEKAGFNEHIVAKFDVLVAEPPVEGKAPRFQVVGAHAFAQGKAPTWVIKGVLPEAELAVMYGASGSGKSFLALDMAGCIVRGTPWRGKRVRQGRVVYVAAEGAGGFRKRLNAYAQANDVDLVGFGMGVIHAAPNMMEVADAADVAKAVNAWGGASIIIIDTFAQVMPGGNENAGEDVGQVLAHCKRIRAATGAMIVLIHHAGKDTSKGARGWSGLRAAADAELEVVRDVGGRLLRLTKSKDGEDGGEWGFGLEVVQIGVDEDLDPITSCVVVEAEVNKARASDRKLGVKEALINEVLQEFAKVQLTGIEIKAVVEEAVRRLDPEPVRRKAEKNNLRRALTNLCESAENYELDEDGLTVNVL